MASYSLQNLNHFSPNLSLPISTSIGIRLDFPAVMTAPNMATITASLERSLQNCSLNNHSRRGGEDDGIGRSSSSDDNRLPSGASDATLELNSHLSLPYHWEQCLDLKTGEIYYINWRDGTRATEDPRTTAAPEYSGGFYSGDDDDDDSSYESEESSSESSPSSLRDREQRYDDRRTAEKEKDKESVLVVAGCKSCLMYFMVPKQVEDCPKCLGRRLLHFDRPENRSS